MKRTFYWGHIFKYGFAAAGISTAVHYLFYLTGWSFTHSLSGLLLMMARMFFLFLVMLLAISRLRQQAEVMNFFMVATHVLLMHLVAAAFHIGYDAYFYHQVDPQYDYKVYSVAVKQTEKNLAESREMKNPKLIADFEARLAQVKALQANAAQGPQPMGQIIQGELRTFLFQGLVNALILGLFFGVMLKPAAVDTSVGAEVIYQAPVEPSPLKELPLKDPEKGAANTPKT
ncbi:MAG: DUF4199 family protein [Bacteroidetes bacterium]|nr:DUF4199 family protein [Bacteroidota bacterium]